MKPAAQAICITLCIALAGCAPELTIADLHTGAKAHSDIAIATQRSGDVRVELNSKSYSGPWSYDRTMRAAFGFGHVVHGATSRIPPAVAGNGKIELSANDQSKISCVFSYEDAGATGHGFCYGPSEYELWIK